MDRHSERTPWLELWPRVTWRRELISTEHSQKFQLFPAELQWTLKTNPSKVFCVFFYASSVYRLKCGLQSLKRKCLLTPCHSRIYSRVSTQSLIDFSRQSTSSFGFITLNCSAWQKIPSKVSSRLLFAGSVYHLKYYLIDENKSLVLPTPHHLQILARSTRKVSSTFPGNQHLLLDLTHWTAVLDKKFLPKSAPGFFICGLGLPLEVKQKLGLLTPRHLRILARINYSRQTERDERRRPCFH